jgi:nucleoside-diphosphate-sugar epimerase
VLAENLRHERLATRLDWPGRVSLLFVEDAVRLLLFLAECPGAANETFFLTSGQATRVGEIVRRIRDFIDAPAKPLMVPAWGWWLARRLAWLPGLTRLVPWRLLHLLDDGLWCDNAKVRSLCPFSLVAIEEGLARTFNLPGSFQRLHHAEPASLS